MGMRRRYWRSPWNTSKLRANQIHETLNPSPKTGSRRAGIRLYRLQSIPFSVRHAVQTVTTDPASVQAVTTTSAGTISEFSPTQSSSRRKAPPNRSITPTASPRLTWMKVAIPFQIETVKSGLPVTVYYVKDGDNLVASKVDCPGRAVVTPAINVQESKTTTTTTTTGK